MNPRGTIYLQEELLNVLFGANGCVGITIVTGHFAATHGHDGPVLELTRHSPDAEQTRVLLPALRACQANAAQRREALRNNYRLKETEADRLPLREKLAAYFRNQPDRISRPGLEVLARTSDETLAEMRT